MVPASQEPQPEVGTSSVDLGPSKDNTLYQASSNFTSNGSGQYLFAGNTRSGSARRALLAFDVAGAIPEGATVNSVTLTLNMSKTQASGQEIGLHRLLADWGEGASQSSGNEGGGTAAASGDATWVHTIFESEEWETPGGDFSSQAAATQEIGDTGRYTWGSTDEMVVDVQSWLEDPSTNFGWLLMGKEDANQTSKRFDSRENGNEANHPVLTVEFTPRK